MTDNEIRIDILSVCKVAGWDGDFNVTAFHLLCDKLKQLGAEEERKRFYGQDKPAECSEVCPPKQICDYCQVVAPVKAMILAEREACAKVCEEEYDTGLMMAPVAPNLAAKIRARGQA